jgi:hypothetical protein
MRATPSHPKNGCRHQRLFVAMRPASAHLSSGAGCSITSAATVSTTGATPFRAAFFTGARLGLALATIRFAFPRADLTALRALLRLAEFCPRRLARIFNFDRLAMIVPVLVGACPIHSVGSKANGQLGKRQIASYQQIAAHCGAERTRPSLRDISGALFDRGYERLSANPIRRVPCNP